MQHIRFILLIGLLLWSCNSGDTIVSEENGASSESQEGIAESSPEEEMTEPADSSIHYLSNLPKEWRKITNYAEEFVFMKYCEAGIEQVSLKAEKGENGSIGSLMHFMGQDSEVFSIYRITKFTEQLGIDIEHSYTFYLKDMEGNDRKMALRVDDKPDQSPIALWSLSDQKEGRMLCTSEKYYANYSELQESLCFYECEGGDECPEAEQKLIGKGVANIPVSPNMKLSFYGSPTSNTAIKVLELNEQAAATANTQWLSSPLEFNPDYELFHMIMLDQKDGRIKVLVSKEPYRTLWIDSKAANTWSWESYWKYALSVESNNGQSLDMYAQADEDSEKVEGLEVGCLKALRLQGEWMEVTVNPDLCESSNLTAWVRWKSGGKLLVWAAWIM